MLNKPHSLGRYPLFDGTKREASTGTSNCKLFLESSVELRREFGPYFAGGNNIPLPWDGEFVNE